MDEAHLTLVVRARKGDPDACRALIEDLHRPVLATTYRLMGGGEQRYIEQIAQDAFVDAFCSLESFDPDRGSFGAWVLRFVRDRCMNKKLAAG